MDPAATSSPKIERAVAGRISKTGMVLLAFVVLLAAGIAFSGWQEAVAAIEKLGPWKILSLCALAGAHYLIRALRWHLIVQAGHIGTTAIQNMRHFFGGFAMTATPGRIGELVRLRWLHRETGVGFGKLLPIAFADRAIELASIVLLIALALTATNLGTNVAWWLLAVAAVLVWVACRPRVLEATVTGLWVLIGRRADRLFVKLRRLTRRLRPFMRMPVMGPTLIIGIVGWGFEGIAFWLLLDWLGAPLGLATATAIFLTAVLSGALSGLPGGLGGTEATSIALLLLQGVPADIAILATAIIRVTTLWFAVAIGFATFPAAEVRASSAKVT